MSHNGLDETRRLEAKKIRQKGGLQYRFGLDLADKAGCPEDGSEGNNADDAPG